MTTILRSEPVKIADLSEFPNLLDLIHDEFFNLEDVRFDPQGHLVEVPYRRVFHEDPGRVIRNWLIFRTHEVDVIRSVLTVHHVQDYSFVDKAQIGRYSFNTLSYDHGVLLIECCPVLELRMVVTKLEIESRDVEIRGKARMTHGLLWDSYSGKVYE